MGTLLERTEIKLEKNNKNNGKVRISFTKTLDQGFYQKLLSVAKKRNVSITSLLFYLASEKLEELVK